MGKRRTVSQKTDQALTAVYGGQSSKSVQIGQNDYSDITAAPIGAAGTVTATPGPAVTLTSGTKFRVMATMSGTASAADLEGTFTLLRNGVAISNAAVVKAQAGHTSPFDINASIQVLDTPSAGLACNYSISCTMTSGTIAVAAGAAGVTVEERQ